MAAFHAEHGYGWYAWLERDSGALVARGGLQPATIDGTQEIEVGWAVIPERWGEGLASELGAACVELAFGPLALGSVVAFTLPGKPAGSDGVDVDRARFARPRATLTSQGHVNVDRAREFRRWSTLTPPLPVDSLALPGRCRRREDIERGPRPPPSCTDG